MRVIHDGAHGDIINQYVTFTPIYNEQVRLYGRTCEVVLETIRICKDNNVLKKYLETRQKKVVDIMMTLFDQDCAWDRCVEEAKKDSEEKGRAEGREEVKKENALSMRERGFSNQVIADILEIETAKMDCGSILQRAAAPVAKRGTVTVCIVLAGRTDKGGFLPGGAPSNGKERKKGRAARRQHVKVRT